MRGVLTEGLEVTVVYLAATEAAVVERIENDGRVVIVVTERGEVLEFHLTATTDFITRDRHARLRIA